MTSGFLCWMGAMEVVLEESFMAGFSVTLQRRCTPRHRSPEVLKLILIVVVDEGCHDHQNVDIIIERVIERRINEMGAE